jgi:magnesium transporter
MVTLPPSARRRARSRTGKLGDEEEGIIDPEGEVPEDGAMWELGDASDDEDGAEVPKGAKRGVGGWAADRTEDGERVRMIDDRDNGEDEEHRESTSSDATLARPEHESTEFVDDEFGEWTEGKARS